MRNILLHTVPVLMGEPGRTPADLVRFLNQGENVDLVEDARRKLPPDEASFFSGEFQAGQYQQTRLAITTKLRVMLQAGRFAVRRPVYRRSGKADRRAQSRCVQPRQGAVGEAKQARRSGASFWRTFWRWPCGGRRTSGQPAYRRM